MTLERDEDFKDRILEEMPEGHTFTAEDLGNAVGEQVDAIGADYGLSRLNTALDYAKKFEATGIALTVG